MKDKFDLLLQLLQESLKENGNPLISVGFLVRMMNECNKIYEEECIKTYENESIEIYKLENGLWDNYGSD